MILVLHGAQILQRASLAQLVANPVFGQADRNDPAATLDLLREANEELRKARLQGAQDQPKRLALVIGSGRNIAWGQLTTTANDANLIASTLRKVGFALFTGAAVLDPDRSTFEKVINDFTHEIGPDTVAMFYFAGHGAYASGDNYLVPSDAPLPQTIGDMDRDLVDVEGTVLRRMKQAGGRLNIIVLDACRDNPLPQSLVVAMRGVGRQYQGLGVTGDVSNMRGTVIVYSAAPEKLLGM